MKRVFTLIPVVILLAAAAGASGEGRYPAPGGFVNDYVGLVSSGTDLELERLLSAVDRRTSAQAAVAIVEDTGGEDIESYAAGLYAKWGVGRKGEDNGVLLLIVTGERKFRIEVGYGLEGVIPDSKAGYILDRVIRPYFRRGEFDAGVKAGVEAVAAEVLREYGLAPTDLVKGYGSAGARRGREAPPVSGVAGTALGVIVIMFLAILFIKNPSLFFMFLLMGGMGSRGSGWRGGGWSGGDFGGFGGGFGGFGGGMSGGGGATSGW
ncbi:MAG: TPM domain-containing protein [bacterium]